MAKDLGKCKYGPEKATLQVTPQAGGPVVNVCVAHARVARKAVQNAKGRKVEVKGSRNQTPPSPGQGGFTPGKKGVNPFAKT